MVHLFTIYQFIFKKHRFRYRISLCVKMFTFVDNESPRGENRTHEFVLVNCCSPTSGINTSLMN